MYVSLAACEASDNATMGRKPEAEAKAESTAAEVVTEWNVGTINSASDVNLRASEAGAVRRSCYSHKSPGQTYCSWVRGPKCVTQIHLRANWSCLAASRKCRCLHTEKKTATKQNKIRIAPLMLRPFKVYAEEGQRAGSFWLSAQLGKMC